MNLSRTTTVTTEHELKLDRQAIIDLLMWKYPPVAVPSDAEVTFHVPGGGDYSGMTLEIEGDKSIRVTWKTRETRDA